jgi:ABC-type uncharacterized transport system permease subunit
VIDFFIPVLGLYGAACALYLAYLASPRDRIARAARWVLFAGLAAHTVEIGMHCVHGLHPVATTPEALSFAAWLLVGAYLLVSLRHRLVVVGGFVAPVALVLEVLGRLAPAAVPHASVATPDSALGRIHIMLSIAGVVLFMLAAGTAFVYLFRERQLKGKRLGAFHHRGPALATLDAVGHRCITLGFPVFTVAIVTGAIWVARLRPFAGGATLRPEYSISLLTWAAFAALLWARTTAGWQGRRAAWLTVVGFGGALLVLIIYLVRYAVGA